jgi:hypothetical protein
LQQQPRAPPPPLQQPRPHTSQPPASQSGALTLCAAPSSEEAWELPDEALATINEDDWLFWGLPDKALAGLP